MMRQILDSEFSRLQDTGEAQAFGTCIDQTTGAKNTLVVPQGQVFLITHVVVQTETLTFGIGTAPTPADPLLTSPDATSYGFDLVDTGGTIQSVANFLTFRRWQATFEVQDSPNWRNAPPGNTIVWRPQYAIPVPSGWTVRSTAGGEYGNHLAVYGYLISENGARTAGYSVSNSSTDTNRLTGISSTTAPLVATSIVPSRAGYSIRILDVYIRMQAKTNVTNKVTLQQADGQKVMSWTSNNPSEMVDQAISPDIFLKPGENLQIVGTVENTASITIVWELVPEKLVPGDAWFAYIEPGYPSPGAPKVGLFSTIVVDSSPVTVYYPRYGTTKTSPTTGFQHIVRGYQVSIQKDTTVQPDQTLLAVSEGSAGGQIQITGTSTQTNKQVTPVFAAVNHDQCLNLAVSGLNIPCSKDTGALWVDTMALAGSANLSILTTPVATDADVDEWSITLWGRTIPHKFTNLSNRGA